MKDTQAKRRKLHRILAEAHRQRLAGVPQPDPAWRRHLMSRLARSSEPAPRIDQWAVMQRLVWRFVPAAGALTLLLAVWLSQFNPDPAGEWSRIMSADAAVSGLYTYYQSESQNE